MGPYLLEMPLGWDAVELHDDVYVGLGIHPLELRRVFVLFGGISR